MPKGKPRDGSKNPGGRPLKYTKEIIEGYAEDFLAFMSKKENFWFKDWAIKRNVPVENLSIWANAKYDDKNLKYPKFSQALKTAKAIQEAKIAKNAMNGTFNASMSIFTLKNVSGWRDKQEIDHTSKGDKIQFYIPEKE